MQTLTYRRKDGTLASEQVKGVVEWKPDKSNPGGVYFKGVLAAGRHDSFVSWYLAPWRAAALEVK